MSDALIIRPTEDSRDTDLTRLREINRHQREEIEQLTTERDEARREARQMQRGVTAVRSILEPLHLGMKALFGELDELPYSPASGPAATSTDDPKRKIWESWKSKLGGMSAKFIDALLEHGQMNVAQLRVAMQCRQQTVYDTASKLVRLGLTDKRDGKYSLKEL